MQPCVFRCRFFQALFAYAHLLCDLHLHADYANIHSLINQAISFVCLFVWSWFGPPLAASRYVMYFRCYGWRYVWVCHQWVQPSGSRLGPRTRSKWGSSGDIRWTVVGSKVKPCFSKTKALRSRILPQHGTLSSSLRDHYRRYSATAVCISLSSLRIIFLFLVGCNILS